MTTVQLLIVPICQLPGFFLEIEDTDGQRLFRKTLPAASQAIEESRGFIELSDAQAEYALACLNGGTAYALANCPLNAKWQSGDLFWNYMALFT